jgi:hypothetical protein
MSLSFLKEGVGVAEIVQVHNLHIVWGWGLSFLFFSHIQNDDSFFLRRRSLAEFRGALTLTPFPWDTLWILHTSDQRSCGQDR